MAIHGYLKIDPRPGTDKEKKKKYEKIKKLKKCGKIRIFLKQITIVTEKIQKDIPPLLN